MWDERYNVPRYVYGTEPNDFLAGHAAAIPKGGRVLCLAEGEGRNALFLARLGYVVTAVDASRIGLQKAARLAQDHGVELELVHQDLADFDIGKSRWDGIVSIFCHLPPALRRLVHRRVVVGLKPAGMLLLEAYTPQQLGRDTGGPRSADLMMTAWALENELAGLSMLHLQELEREVIEGEFHTGVGAVVQVLARK
jgi:SAM-dependent methyltransferase